MSGRDLSTGAAAPARPGRRLRLAARGALLAGLTLLAACGREGSDQETLRRLSLTLVDQLRLVTGTQEEGEPPRQLSRAEINDIDSALIGIAPPGEPLAYFVAFAAKPDGKVTYLNPSMQSVTLQGSAVHGVHSLGDQRIGYRADLAEDFLSAPRPVREWPAQVTRVIRFLDGVGRPFSRTFVCAPRPIGPTQLTLADVDFELIEVEETCRSPYRSFTNRYWADEETGFVWKSLQWIGPNRGSLEVTILTPFAL